MEKRRQNKHKIRWIDEVGDFFAITWNRQVCDRDEYRKLGEASVL